MEKTEIVTALRDLANARPTPSHLSKKLNDLAMMIDGGIDRPAEPPASSEPEPEPEAPPDPEIELVPADTEAELVDEPATAEQNDGQA